MPRSGRGGFLSHRMDNGTCVETISIWHRNTGNTASKLDSFGREVLDGNVSITPCYPRHPVKEHAQDASEIDFAKCRFFTILRGWSL